jgi:hypothetical protein
MVPNPHSLAYSIGKGKRSDLANSRTARLVPGPGNYEQEKKFLKSAPKWGFGSGMRPSMEIRQGTKDVGPGQYEVKQRAVEGQKYSFGIINYQQKKYGSISPGPGAYSPTKKGNEVNLSYSMAGRLINSASTKHSSNMPGPGNYNPAH